jgi:ATP-dependent exoDNAse (exonuclease V) beta subunit
MDDVDALARIDATARAQALDVTQSWLVQAPAGSGKTELLIARYLALLAIVERPEAILAMTFTRKAAAEMRERVVEALQEAAADVGDATADPPPHVALTRRLARAALARDHQLGWRLLEQPSRLRIITIDAMATALARQAPLASALGALPRFVDDAELLYQEAARRALGAATAGDADWRTFLRWLDNDATSATRLIAQMLAARDRWPMHVFADDPAALRADVERVLEWEVRAALRAVRTRIPPSLAAALPGHARHAIEHFDANGAAPTFADAVRTLARTAALPGDDARDAWLGLADWLLTGSGSFKRSVNVNHGFPAGGTTAGAFERARRKTDFVRWLVDAAAVPGLAESWHRLRSLPPTRHGDDAWAFVVAAMRILPAAAEALADVFGARGAADFTEATLRALAALGASEAPSELLLAVDYRLSHLLIDEFQDTSRAQLALIGRLCEGWEAGDGRTLFAVGDPMQSIYRFRQAEVRLFIEAQARRSVGGIDVGVVELTRNFRSQRTIVDWVNHVFGHVLPRESDPGRGEAGYRSAYADASTGMDVAPTLDLLATRADEAGSVVARVREALAAGMSSVAVLVRARSHAQALLPALRAAGIEFSAVDLEGLHDRLATRDLLSLARALAQPADRLAWLSVLRAPWCGLPLADLLIVAQASSGRPVHEAVDDEGVRQALSDDSRTRIARFATAVAPALAARGTHGFALRVRSAWLALGGPACTPSALDRAGADRVFALLAEQERGGDLADHELLVAMAQRLFAAASESAARVQVMTLHRAKGLQFDAVVLPALDLETGGISQPLLRWRVREHDGEATLVLAPMRARVGPRAEPDPVYAWLGTLDAAEEIAELGRLLYVGATRAKRRLHLTAVAGLSPSGSDWKRPARGSPLERLWDALATTMPPPAAAMPGSTTVETPEADSLLRLPVAWGLPALPERLPVGSQVASRADAPIFDWADAVAAAIGTVSHRLLAQIAREGLAAWDERRLQDERARIAAELGSEGIEPALRERATQRVAAVVAGTLSDRRGRWLFDPAHADAHSEWALAGVDNGALVHVTVDRSFVVGGVRYVVDFKTGAHLGGDAATFLRREFDRYRPQLERYARIVSALDARPVRIALYHPLVPDGWQEHEWGTGD